MTENHSRQSFNLMLQSREELLTRMKEELWLWKQSTPIQGSLWGWTGPSLLSQTHLSGGGIDLKTSSTPPHLSDVGLRTLSPVSVTFQLIGINNTEETPNLISGLFDFTTLFCVLRFAVATKCFCVSCWQSWSELKWGSKLWGWMRSDVCRTGRYQDRKTRTRSLSSELILNV